MRNRLLITAIAVAALTGCEYFADKPKPAPEPTTAYQAPPAPAPEPAPEIYLAAEPEPYPAPAQETYVIAEPEPYPAPAPETYVITEPDPYPAPAPETYITTEPYPAPVQETYVTTEPEPYPIPDPYPAPEPDPYGGPTPGPVSDAAITLEEGPCFGTCPIYTLTIYPTEFYELDAGQFTINQGMSTGTLPAGSWAAARAALTTADFNNLPTDVTPGNPVDCGNQVATDLPTARISETTIAGTRTVNYYPGCFAAPAKPALDQLVADLRSAMQVTGLVVAP